MTIADLITEFRTTYDLGNIGLPGFEDEEIKLLLERAQYTFINNHIKPNSKGQSFFNSKTNIDELRRLIRSLTLNVLTVGNSFRTVKLPDDYLHTISLKLEYDDGDEEAIQIDYSQLSRFQSSKRNKEAYIKNPVFLADTKSSYGSSLKIYNDSSYSDTPFYKFVYINKPRVDMTTASEELSDFSKSGYHDIVRIAVDDATFIVSPSKSQISQQRLNKIE